MQPESLRLLKAHAARELGDKVAFNYEDIRRRCDEHVERVRAQTRQMLQQATHAAEVIRQRAHEQGLQAGYQHGLARAEDEIGRRAHELADRLVADRLDSVLPAMRAALQGLQRQRDVWLAQWETVGIRLSVAIAEKLLRRDLNARPDRVIDLVRAALELAVGMPRLTLRLHPQDLQCLGARPEQCFQELASGAEVTLRPDERISRGGCLVETPHGVIDARLETQLERIAAELLADAGPADADG